VGYSVENLARLGLQKNLLPDGCRNEDGSYTFNDLASMRTGKAASFTVNFEGDEYTGEYRGLAVIKAGKKTGLQKMGVTGFTSLRRNGEEILRFQEPTDVFVERKAKEVKLIIADKTGKKKPLINKL